MPQNKKRTRIARREHSIDEIVIAAYHKSTRGKQARKAVSLCLENWVLAAQDKAESEPG